MPDTDALADDAAVIARIPVAEERVVTGKRTQERIVRIRRSIGVRAEDVETDLVSVATSVDRRPVGRFVRRAPRPRWEGDVLVVPVIEEVLVVEKRLRLVEEVRIARRKTSHRVKETVTLRRTRVDVER